MTLTAGVIVAVMIALVETTEVEYYFDRDCVESPATLICPYKGPGVLASTHDHSSIRRVKLEQLTGLYVVMASFADHVTVEYHRSPFHDINVCAHL
jgi:hypothetical protein